MIGIETDRGPTTPAISDTSKLVHAYCDDKELVLTALGGLLLGELSDERKDFGPLVFAGGTISRDGSQIEPDELGTEPGFELRGYGDGRKRDCSDPLNCRISARGHEGSGSRDFACPLLLPLH